MNNFFENVNRKAKNRIGSTYWSPDAKPSFQLSTIYKFWKERDMSQFVSDVFIDVTYCPRIVLVSLGRRFR